MSFKCRDVSDRDYNKNYIYKIITTKINLLVILITLKQFIYILLLVFWWNEVNLNNILRITQKILR